MSHVDFRLPFLFDYAAKFAWASSGAVVGIRKHFDIVGVFVMALLSSTGGGLIRDGLLLHRTPSLLINPVDLPLVVVAAVLMSQLVGRLDFINLGGGGKLVDFIDALGTPAYAVIGMQLAAQENIAIPGIVFVGIVNGVTGGLLRDVVVSDVPALLRPGQYQTLILLLACVLFQVLKLRLDVRPNLAAWITVATFFLVRLLAIRFNWRSRSVLHSRANKDRGGLPEE